MFRSVARDVAAGAGAGPEAQVLREPRIAGLRTSFEPAGNRELPRRRLPARDQVFRFFVQCSKRDAQQVRPFEFVDLPSACRLARARQRGYFVVLHEGRLEFATAERPPATEIDVGARLARRPFRRLSFKIGLIAPSARDQVAQLSGSMQWRGETHPRPALRRMLQVPVTPMRIRCQLRRGHELCPHRIEVNVIAYRAEYRTVLKQQAFVAALKQVAVFASQPVEPIREGRRQPLHACDEVSLRRLHSQVIVIPHDDKRVQQPSAAFTPLEKAGFERSTRRGRIENPPAVVAAVDDVIQSPGKFEPQLARHPASHVPAYSDDHLSDNQFQVGLPAHRRHNGNFLNLTPLGGTASWYTKCA